MQAEVSRLLPARARTAATLLRQQWDVRNIKVICRGFVAALPAEQVRAGLVDAGDLEPTLLDAMGHPVPEHLEGRSRLPAVRNGRPTPDDDVFIEWHGEGVGRQPVAGSVAPGTSAREPDPISAESVRTVVTADNWKLNISSIGDHELYDLSGDPLELDNLYGSPQQRDRVDAMADTLHRWQQRTGDSLPLPI